MKPRDKLLALEEKATAFGRRWAPRSGPQGGDLPSLCPTDVVDLIVFHKLELSMPFESALKSYRNLKTRFVDWNEVRVTSLREIQEVLAPGPESLGASVFIKEFLEFVHRERQRVSLEFLVEENFGEIRRYLKQVRGLDPATVNFVLRVRKDLPVVPLNRAMERVLDRIGLLRSASRREQKERALHERLAPENALAVHHFLLNHSQEYCPPDETNLACERCCMRRVCAFYAWSASRRKRRPPARNSRPSGAPAAALRVGAAK
ncbi:MAG: hypothetical protein ACUVYA_17890, partial [Planctomycetota bacterium]